MHFFMRDKLLHLHSMYFDKCQTFRFFAKGKLPINTAEVICIWFSTRVYGKKIHFNLFFFKKLNKLFELWVTRIMATTYLALNVND